MQIYFAAPLFCDAELQFNEEVSGMLEDAGHSVFLPQRDGWSEMDEEYRQQVVEEGGPEAKMEKIFEIDRDEVYAADLLTAVLDGRVPDEGVALEMGLAYANDIPVVGLKTDRRVFSPDEPLNAMLYGVLEELTETPQELVETVAKFEE
ncbi:MAG: nucleoside 2-deoxyribosyltransferase [Halobacteriaceae archaeon]